MVGAAVLVVVDPSHLDQGVVHRGTQDQAPDAAKPCDHQVSTTYLYQVHKLHVYGGSRSLIIKPCHTVDADTNFTVATGLLGRFDGLRTRSALQWHACSLGPNRGIDGAQAGADHGRSCV